MSALILISVLGVVLLYLGFGNNRRLLAPVSIAGLLGALALFTTGWHIENALVLKDLVRLDGFAMAFNRSLILVTVLPLLLVYRLLRRHEMALL